MIIGSINASFTVANGGNYVKLFIHKENLSRWCMNLCSLEKEVVKHIHIFDDSNKMLGMISMSSDNSNSFSNDSICKIKLSSSAIDYWLGFLLRYSRDGIAEVDHIDVDAGIEGEISQDRSIILMVDVFSNPMSSDEMNKLLGM